MKTSARETFVPFTSATKLPAAAGSDTRLTVVHQPANVQPFHAAAVGSALGALPALTPPPSAAEPAPAPQACTNPRISLERDGNRITAVKIECSCGQVFELACVYE